MIRPKETVFNMYDGNTLKWRDGEKLHCLHIQQDDMPESPREWDNVTIMACWHSRYKLGDRIDDKEPEDFWQRLVRENVPKSEVYAMAEAGRLEGIRIAKNEANPDCVDVYEMAAFGREKPKEYLEYEEVNKETALYYLMDDLTVQNCMKLLEPYAEWLPLWLYDHSGITMSCGTRSYPYNDRWDSGAVGWIVALKSIIMKEVGTEYVLDENGARIKVEHPHKNGSSTWSYKTRPLTDETWKQRAIEIMKNDVKIYDQYLTGNVYGFTLYDAEPVEEEEELDWEESDSCWGFYGENILENGICDHVGSGILEAIRTGRCKIEETELHTVQYYTF